MNFRSMLTMFLCAAVMIGGAIGGRAQQPAAPERPKVVRMNRNESEKTQSDPISQMDRRTTNGASA